MSRRASLPRLVHLEPRSELQAIHQSRTALMCERDGFVRPNGTCGLFVHDTRVLSRYVWTAGSTLEPAGCSPVDARSWLGYYVLGADVQEAVELRLARFVSDGFHEDVDLTSFVRETKLIPLTLEVAADFIGVDEAQDGKRRQRGEQTTRWREDAWEIEIVYRAERAWTHHGRSGVASTERAVIVRVHDASSPPSYADGKISFSVVLPPRGTWHACVDVAARIDGELLEPRSRCRAFYGVHNERDVARGTFEHVSTKIEIGEPLAAVAASALEQARQDLAALRLSDIDHGERSWVAAAGAPMYLALFGRDSLTTGWQSGMLSIDLLDGALRELALLQGTKDDPWRDEEPGKMLHQVRRSPLAALELEPWSLHYGAATTSAFYPTALASLWHWTGDRERIAPLIEPAMRAIRWLDERADLDGDGFYEYQSRSERPQKHQGWKDSDDAMVHADGRPGEPPIASCEEQAFAYLAKLHLSEVLYWLGRRDEARRLYHEASELKKRFNARFWMADERFFGLGLDRDKELMRSLTSNPGHCLAAGIVDTALVEDTAARLFSRELWSGWGVRTLASDHPRYNPYSYHRGTVWPVEQATFALGLTRYGLRGHSEMLVRAQLELASIYAHHRLPECLAGHARDLDHPFPALYPRSCSPQAWSASALFTMVQSMLGLYPYAPLHALLVDPALPAWLPAITLRDLRVGEAIVTIDFARKDGKTDFTVRDLRGPLHVIRQPSPWSLTASFAERFKDVIVSVIK